MNHQIIQDAIDQAIAREYDQLAKDHPNLARVIDRPTLAAGASQSILNDPEFHRVIGQSIALRESTQTFARLVDQYVVEWLKRLW